MITVKRTPGRLFDAFGSRLGRPQRCLFKYTIPIGNSVIPSVSGKMSPIPLSHHSRPPSLNIILNRRNFSTSLPKSSQPETSPSIAGTAEADDMDTNTATVDEDTAVLGYETWKPAIVALRGAVRAAYPSSPRPTPTSSRQELLEFNAYWRGVFDNLHKQVESDDTIPKFLATPPLKKFEIIIFTENSGLDCPCCLPYVVPSSIILENEDGITKGDLIRGVGRYLYGLDLDPNSPLVVKRSGGVDEQTGELTPMVHSEYEITIKPAYPPYLVKGGDRKRTLEQERANEHRPLGGWPLGDGSTSDLNLDLVPGLGKEEGPESESVSSKLTQLELEDKAAENEEIEKTTLQTQPEGDQAEAQTDPDMTDTNADKEATEPSSIEFEDAPAVYRFPAVIYDYSWMSGCGKGPNGEKEIYAHWSLEGRPEIARIWLFVCPPEVFEERVERAEEGLEKKDQYNGAAGEKEGDSAEGKGKRAEGN